MVNTAGGYHVKMCRKKIGVVVSQVEGYLQHPVIKGITKAASDMNYDVLVFAIFIKDKMDEEYSLGEMNIFNLIEFEMLSGIIILPDSFKNIEEYQNLENQIKKICSNVVSVDVVKSFCPSVIANDCEAMKKITDHLIEKHKVRNIAIVTGPKEHEHAINRMRGVTDSLEAHGILVDYSQIFYGNFWYNNGEQVAAEYLKKGRPLPEAFICASDTIAIGICETLKKEGIRIPEDVIVTGYDISPITINYKPVLTSSKMAREKSGIHAVKILDALINKSEYEDSLSMTLPEVIFGDSCGCNNDDCNSALKKVDQVDEEFMSNFYYNNNLMIEDTIRSNIFETNLEKIAYYTYQIGTFFEFFLCLCDNWDSVGYGDTRYIQKGYSKYMNLSLHLIGQKTQNLDENRRFLTSDILPAFSWEHETPTAYFFTPLHYYDRCFGYTVIAYKKDMEIYSGNYRGWMRNMNIIFESIRLRNNYLWSKERLERSAVTDSLTRLYNRVGLENYKKDFLDESITSRKPLLVLVADVNGLKEINDTFGHLEGDFAISFASRAFRTHKSGTEKCFRFGGDEFILLGVGDYTDETVSDRIGTIKKFLADYNEKKEKPFRVELSLGYYFEPYDGSKNMDQYILAADIMMYQDKKNTKGVIID